MGRFGKNRVPNFMKGKEDAIGANPRVADENLDEMHPVEIVSLGDHGDDHAMIVIKSKSGEELELRFDYDGNGMLTATHDDHEYSIPVEIEVVSDEDHEEEEMHMSPSGRMTNMSPEDDDYEINYGRSAQAYEKLTAGQKKLDKNKNGKLDKQDFKLLNKSKKEADGKAVETFESFVNECWSPMTEGYNPAMSEEAKRAIKAICEEMLIKEAQMCDEDSDPNHTYENYLNEAGSYMSKCMMEAAAEVDVEEPINEGFDYAGVKVSVNKNGKGHLNLEYNGNVTEYKVEVDVTKAYISWYKGPIAVEAAWKDGSGTYWFKDNTDKVFKADKATLDKMAKAAKSKSPKVLIAGTGSIKGVNGDYTGSLTKVA